MATIAVAGIRVSVMRHAPESARHPKEDTIRTFARKKFAINDPHDAALDCVIRQIHPILECGERSQAWVQGEMEEPTFIRQATVELGGEIVVLLRTFVEKLWIIG